MAGQQRPGAYVRGLADLRRVLKRANKELDRSLAATMRATGRGVRDRVREQARRFRDSGDLERSVRYSVTQKRASVFSNLPYAPVHEWGGEISPRGVPIRIPRREWMAEGVRQSRRAIDSDMERLLDGLADDFASRSGEL